MSKLKSNSQGMSLVEALMGLVVLSIFMMGLTSLLNFAADQNQKIVVKTDQGLDALVGERTIFTDLKYLTPSFNNMVVRDNMNRMFFDYFPDLPINLLGGALERRLTISATEGRSLTFITLDPSEAPPMIYDPSAAFTFTESPADLSVSGLFQFRSVNRDGYVNRVQRTVMNVPTQDYWRDGKIVMLDTPARVRPLVGSGTINLLTPPRSPIFVGRVEGGNLVQINMPEINHRHPREGIPVVTNPRDFLIRLPEVGGTAPMVRLAQVKIIRYSAVRVGTNRINLVRSVYSSTGFSEAQTIANNLVRVEFIRDSVQQPMVSFNLTYAEASP